MTPVSTHNHSAPKTTARILGGVAVLIVLLAIGIIPRVLRAREAHDVVQASTVLHPEVTIVHPEKAPAETSLSLPGNLQPMYSASVYARTNGYIEKRFVDIGTHVKAGQLLAIIATPEIDQQLNQARADVVQASAVVLQTKASLQQVQANLDIARITRDRYAPLIERHAVTQQSLDEANEALNARTADVAAANANIAVADASLKSRQANVAQFEHAIAILVGKPPAALTIARTPINIDAPQVPGIPGVLPSELLERRPDVAAAERRMASANEQIGIAQAAYYPTLSLSAILRMQGTSALNWFTWPSRFWAVGPSMSETLFDGGRRHSVTDKTRADYDGMVANYRQTALEAFQQVEDNLAALRILQTETEQQHHATAEALESLDTFQARYTGGLELYLQVITSQTTALQNQRNDIDLMRRQLDASVLLIKAVGGGWDTAQLPKM